MFWSFEFESLEFVSSFDIKISYLPVLGKDYKKIISCNTSFYDQKNFYGLDGALDNLP